MIDRKRFFASIRPTPINSKRLIQSQVNTLDAILDEAERRDTDLRWVGDMMGTALGEVGIKLAPVREGFKTTDADARRYVQARGYRYALAINGTVYYGRGLVQVTWIDNCKKLTALAKAQGHEVDFVTDPDLLLTPKWAVWAMFEGMERGLFTGKKLGDYYNAASSDWINSRRIINGLDRAVEIGGYKKQFYADLVASQQ